MATRTKSPKLSGVEKKIYNTIKAEKRIKPLIIVNKTKLSPRSVRHALKKLENKALISKVPDLMDLRSFFYFLID
jgi:DNA-binding MarR family transcriptional regulator